MTKVIEKVKCMVYGIVVIALIGFLIANVVMTHGNNVFRMQVALGMNLESLYCEDITLALGKANCLVADPLKGEVIVNGNKLECRELLNDELQCVDDYKNHDLGESLSKRCTREIIDFYDCLYPASTDQDIQMRD